MKRGNMYAKQPKSKIKKGTSKGRGKASKKKQ
jgi:hypothetical protein